MTASPARVVRQILLRVEELHLVLPSDGRGAVPYMQTPGDESVLCYTSSMPDEVDQALCIYGPAGRIFPKRMDDGRHVVHPGLKFEFRALTDDGYDVIQKVANAVDAIKSLTSVAVDGEDYYVQSVYRTSPVIELGEERYRKRQLWVFNARVAFQDRQFPAMG